MKERIRQLRKLRGLTQKEFADKIGLTQKSLTGYETGRRKPSKAAINNICKTFSVSEAWLTTGVGEMFVPQVTDGNISAYVDVVLQSTPDNIRRRFLAALAVLDDTDLAAVERFAQALLYTPSDQTGRNW